MVLLQDGNPFTSADHLNDRNRGRPTKEDKPKNVLQEDERQSELPWWQWPIVRECGSTPEQDDVMIFGEKVRLVSPFAAAEVLVSVLRH